MSATRSLRTLLDRTTYKRHVKVSENLYQN